MFPNPQDALPQPPHPNVDHYRKLAKDLVKVCKAGKPGGISDWASAFVQGQVQISNLDIPPNRPVDISRWIDQLTEFAATTLLKGERTCSLADSQFVIARSLGFTSWPKFVRNLEGAGDGTSVVKLFEAAADAIISGDIKTLKKLLQKNPELIRQRSTREHRATLLHYASANGVEGYRQRTPQNIVEIAELLLKSGAEVDAEAEMYGGGCTTLGLAATSVHPEVAGVQQGLLQLLLDYGAQIGKPNLAGNQHGAVISCLANGRILAGVFLAARGAPLDLEAAAGVGQLDVVKACLHSNETVVPSVAKEQLQRGFLWACMGGWEDVAIFLLEHGAELRDPADTGATGLHWAAGGAHVSMVQKLIEHGSPLEEIN